MKISGLFIQTTLTLNFSGGIRYFNDLHHRSTYSVCWYGPDLYGPKDFKLEGCGTHVDEIEGHKMFAFKLIFCSYVIKEMNGDKKERIM